MTRVMSFVHAGVLLLSVFTLGPLIGRIPLAALAGVLMITAWRMNEWESIHFFTRTRLKHAIVGVLVTLSAPARLATKNRSGDRPVLPASGPAMKRKPATNRAANTANTP